MQYAQNGLIIHLTNGLRIIILETNLIPKNMINFKKSRTAIEISSFAKNNLFIRHYHVHE